MSLPDVGVSPASIVATAAAQALPWALAAKADFAMAPLIAASPITWMFRCNDDSKVTGSIGHQPVRSATPAACAIAPAFCGGTTLATAAVWRAKSVTSVLVAGSTLITLPSFDRGTHS